jgi:thymidylate kinase
MRVVFEGLPGAGKTTTTAVMADRLKCPLIPAFAGFSDRIWLNFRFSQPYYKTLDEVKDYLARQFVDSPILIDRHYIGTLAYAYALTSVKGKQREDGECYPDQLQWYRNCFHHGILTSPDVVVLLDITPELSLQRQPTARAEDAVWGDINCLEAMRYYYGKFFELIEPDIKVLWIDASEPLENVISNIERAI